jgi:hypothetical protein
MQYPNLLKRIVPFVLALILGLGVASFFVDLTPSVKFRGRGFRQMREDYRELKLDYERLKRENEELKKNPPTCEEAEYRNFKLYKEHKEAMPPPIIVKPETRKNSDGVGSGSGYGYGEAQKR